jgi:hypothetical protein
MRLIGRLVGNAIVGLILLYVTNVFLSDEVPDVLAELLVEGLGTTERDRHE